MNNREAFEAQMRKTFGEKVNLNNMQTITGEVSDEYISPSVRDCWTLFSALASQAKQTESKPSIEDVQNLVDASESIMKWLVENVHRWNFKAYDRLHLATMRVKDSIPPAPEGESK